ncbi:hypothetical protein DUI87_03617 [Hirundo rustica rustica]|uniref:ribonuclease H n=1 Tax=Hirundo rustica rustica TaxID=333673 RepID=A0A3M0L0Z6_HIRRU|nr:hypothetical protein DUI87_03617 [Hirundo rustica rustica]
MLRNQTLHGVVQRLLEEEGKRNKCKTTASVSTETVIEEAVSTSTQTVTEEKGTKNKATKKKSKSKSVRIVTDEDVAGPSHPAEETEPEIITCSLSLGELHDLRKEFTRQANESILTWLLRIWVAAANDTILDGSEARYLCKEDRQVHKGKWSTMEQGIRCLRELAVLEIIFSEDERFPKSPDDVQCTSQMWLRFARLGPEMYSRYLAMLQWREGEDKVGVLVNKLRIYEDTVTAPFRTHVSSVETRLVEQFWSLIEEGHQKLKKELKEEIYHILPEPTRVSAIRSRYPPARERGYTPRGNLWSFLPGAWRRHAEVGWKTHLLLSSPAECRAQFAFTWKGIQYTWNQLPQGWKHSPTICHGVIQTALEKGEAPEHLQYIDDIIVWGNTAGERREGEKGEKIIQILLKAGFAIKRSKVKGPAQEIQFLGVKWRDGYHQIPTEVINRITAMSPPTKKKET